MSNESDRTQGHILELVPALRAFAMSLTRNASDADDLVQETLMKALAAVDQLQPNSNLKAWLFTIERNTYYTIYRRRRRESGRALEDLRERGCEPSQEWSLKLKAIHGAIEQLPLDQKEALMLVGGAGMSYEEAAEICGCALGTIKSRINRGRSRLLQLLDSDSHREWLEQDMGRV